MSRAGRIAAIASGLAVGAALVAPKVAAGRMRRRPDDPDSLLEPIVETRFDVATHDRGSIHVIEAGRGPAIVLSHGVTLSMRTW